MHVQYWKVGAQTATDLALTTSEVSGHLLEDWVPSLPAKVSSAFVGWPPFLTERVRVARQNYLAMHARAGRSDRQWKGVLSWMMGVAGTRHILADEGYRWIAPLSAFYDESALPVDHPSWPVSFPTSSIAAASKPTSPSRLRPDYLALRQRVDRSYELAVAESKGTAICLTSMHKCPDVWRDQVQNVEVRVNGSVVRIPRHIVVATRVNPNALNPKTRRIQIRAWNSDVDSEERPPDGVGADIAAAHLFGIFNNLGLVANARAQALAVALRHDERSGVRDTGIAASLDLAWVQADIELQQHASASSAPHEALPNLRAEIQTDVGPATVEIDGSVATLARSLSRARTAQQADAALRRGDEQIDTWFAQSRPRDPQGRRIALPDGIQITFPQSFAFENDV